MRTKLILLTLLLVNFITSYAQQTAQEYVANAHEKLKRADYEGAIEDFTKAIAIEPDHNSYDYRGFAKYKLDDRNGAIADYTKAIEINPNDATAYYLRANAKLDTKNFSEAIADYTMAIKIDPFGEAYLYRGMAKIFSGEKDNGCLDLSKAIELGNTKAKEEKNKFCP